MPPPSATPLPADADADAALRDDLQRAQRAPAWHLAFPPRLESHMEAELGAQRRRQLIGTGLVALLVYDLFLLNDLLVRPEALAAALWCRLGLMSGYGLAVLALVQRGLPPRWREGLMASTVVVAMLASGEIFRHTRAAAGAYDPFVFSLVFMAGNIVFPLRFRAAMVSSALGFLVCLPYVLGSPLMPADSKGFALGLLAGTAVFTTLACYRIERATRQSYLLALAEALRAEAAQRLADRMDRLSRTDPLTGLLNRRAFDEALMQRCEQAARQHGGVSLLLLDVDHFKRFNDRYGHPAGDACLRQVALAMGSTLRHGDLLARIGGEEFALLPRETSPQALARSAETVCRAVEALGIAHADHPGAQVVTLSAGAVLHAGPGDPWPHLLLLQADEALYQAKHAGRNRWVIAGAGPAEAAPAFRPQAETAPLPA